MGPSTPGRPQEQAQQTGRPSAPESFATGVRRETEREGWRGGRAALGQNPRPGAPGRPDKAGLPDPAGNEG
ncbi:hypothetical protein BDY21DRAFT_343694 [Lineolata rhizophorae]|uniref:Uncharacterized protein n=1 Tax=Lineolata rhizophorae TaxID=578093 RepID=A0A6A6P1P8_9PEZI|nr:hypothetical protein BDY21DRAFT_343694 [Lineolata rhizophorae]